MSTDEVIRLKAEIFDLQIELSRVRKEIEKRLARLSEMNKETGGK